jgi:hypothetical protein
MVRIIGAPLFFVCGGKLMLYGRIVLIHYVLIFLVTLPGTLRAENEAIIAMWTACNEKRAQEKPTCYQPRLEKILHAQDTEQALTALEQLAARDPDVLREAHAYAHHLGRVSFPRYQDAPTAFSHCRPTFWSGCYHGVLESYLTNLPQTDSTAIATLCRDAFPARQSMLLKYQCLHGLGHGLTMHLQHDIQKSLTFCDALPTTWDRESCYGGVFMENIVAFQNAQLHHHHSHTGQKNFLDPQDPLSPCNAVAEKYQEACYLMQTSAILTFTNHNFARAFAICDTAPAQFVPTCYQSLGRDASGFTLRNINETTALCQLGKSEYRHYCLAGAVKDFMLTAADAQPGFAFCRALSAEHKKECYVAVGEVLAFLHPDQAGRAQACTGAEQEYAAVCTASARLF